MGFVGVGLLLATRLLDIIYIIGALDSGTQSSYLGSTTFWWDRTSGVIDASTGDSFVQSFAGAVAMHRPLGTGPFFVPSVTQPLSEELGQHDSRVPAEDSRDPACTE